LDIDDCEFNTMDIIFPRNLCCICLRERERNECVCFNFILITLIFQ
jgi:hypothetical protein